MAEGPRQKLRDRAKNIPASIKAPATNVTLGAGISTAIATFLLAWNKTFEGIFGKDTTEGTRKDVLVALLFALALVLMADLFSRAIAASAHERGVALVAAAGLQHPGVSPIFPGIPATITTGADKPGFLAIAMRTNNADERSYLLVKAGNKPQWVAEGDLELNPETEEAQAIAAPATAGKRAARDPNSR